jgi:hypothetical protein
LIAVRDFAVDDPNRIAAALGEEKTARDAALLVTGNPGC